MKTGDNAAKWELIRRLRYGALLRLFRHRWGHVLPNDDAGRDDLWLLVTNVSLAAAEPEKKTRHVIEMWAPWMSREEREAYVQHVWGLDIYERTPTARELGKRLGLTNAEREALKLWPFLPIDKTKEELAEIARARRNNRRRERARAAGVRTRATYLTELTGRPKPWIAAGMSRAAYYRKRKRDEVMSKVRRGPVLLIVDRQVPHRVSLKEESPQMGCQEGVLAESLIIRSTEVAEMEAKASGSSELVPNPVSLESSTDVPEIDPRIAALGKWGQAVEHISPEQQKRYKKICARFDALPDPRLRAAAA
jgi:hypothetical protein